MQYPFRDKQPRRISSPFGWRVHPITGNRRFHAGVDMVDRAGTPIVAPESGLVLESRESAAAGGGFGFYVKLQGDSGAVHILAHMVAGSLTQKKGNRVTQGTVLGGMGTTGASTGVHLHWEVHQKNNPIDPMGWVQVIPADFKAWTQNRNDGTAKAFIRNAPHGAKVRVRHNTESVYNRTVRPGDVTLEKTVTLIPGRNRVTIELDGTEVKGATYNLTPAQIARLRL
jgi:murein DD-endopeptidase MepM/ murein hydrolase activator NlpD